MNDERVRTMVANGAIPTIEGLIAKYRNGNEFLYGTILEIGRVCDTYHKVLQTGNSVECAELVCPPTESDPIDNGIEYLDLSVRTWQMLKRSHIDTIRQLLGYSYKDLLKLRNIGKNTADEIVRKVEEKGYVLKEAENEDSN